MGDHRRKYRRSRRQRRAGRVERERVERELAHMVSEMQQRIRADIDRLLAAPACLSDDVTMRSLVSDALVRSVLLKNAPVGQRRAMRAQFREADRRRQLERARSLSPGVVTVIR